MKQEAEVHPMEPRVDVITLAVADLDRALKFYRDGLGLESRGIMASEFVGDAVNAAGAVVMFDLRGGQKLALNPRTELAKDAKITAQPAKSGEFSLAQMAGSKAEVKTLLAKAEAAGATITDQPHERPWGIFSGYFRDPDGHLWEIIWSPSRSTQP